MLRKPDGRIVLGARSTTRDCECTQHGKHQSRCLCALAPARTKFGSVYAVPVAGRPSCPVFHHWNRCHRAASVGSVSTPLPCRVFLGRALSALRVATDPRASTAPCMSYLRCVSYHLKNS